jgi:hypothetical protein
MAGRGEEQALDSNPAALSSALLLVKRSGLRNFDRLRADGARNSRSQGSEVFAFPSFIASASLFQLHYFNKARRQPTTNEAFPSPTPEGFMRLLHRVA